MKHKFVYVFIFLLFIVLAAYLAFANIGSVTLNLANYTNTSNATINFTFTPVLNDTAGIVLKNATLYYRNLSGSGVEWNASRTNQSVLAGNATQSGINLSNSILNEGIYLWNVYVCDNQSNCSFAAANYTIRVDRTAPENMTYAPTTLAASANQSGNFLINITATDAGSGVKNISIFVNGSLVQNCSSSPCNWTNNSVDGSYIFNATAEDFATNKNVSIGSRTVTIDTVAPTVSLSCSPSSVSVSQSITCTCAASDATSGVRNYSYALSSSTASTSSTASQDTSVVGTFTETCTVRDYAGNSNSATASYTVSGGGGLPEGWTPSVITYNIGTLTEAGRTREIKESEKVKFVSEEVEYTSTIDEVTATTAKLTIATQTFTLNIGDEKKLDLNNDDIYDTSITLVGITESKAELTFKAISEAVTLPPEEEVVVEKCGNDIVDAGENCKNCPEDVKCAADEECKEGVCAKVVPPKAKLTWLWIALGVLVIGIVVYLATKKKK